MYAYRNGSPIIKAGLRFQEEVARREADTQRGIDVAIAERVRQREREAEIVRKARIRQRRDKIIVRLDLMFAYMPRLNEPSITQITYETAAKYGVTFQEIRSPRRFKTMVRARQEAMWRAIHETTKSYPQIAAFFGGRDHTTVIHGVKTHQRRIDRGEA